MKKVRLNLKRGVRAWSITLYDSVESAYYLKDEPVLDDEIEEYRRTVFLSPGEVLEVEWVGSEWVYSDDADNVLSTRVTTTLQHKFDNVRIGKWIPIKGVLQKTACVELYSGWVSGEDMKWSGDDTQRGIRITPIKGRMRSKFDFSKLFVELEEDSPEETSSLEKSVSASPSDLN